MKPFFILPRVLVRVPVDLLDTLGSMARITPVRQ
jgi:hypothetical protein